MAVNEELAQYIAAQEGLNPDVLTMMLKAMSPKTPYAATIGEGGETKFTYVPPETKAAKEKEKPQAGQEGQPKDAKNIGYGPAMAAMTAPSGEPVSAAELRGLTPEQISTVMGMEAKAEQMRQGTVGQLMELPYRQALTERAIRPDVSLELARINKMLNPLQQTQLKQLGIEMALRGEASGKSIEFLEGLSPAIIAAMDLPPQVLKAMYEEEKLPKKAEWIEWRNKETGEIKPMRPGQAPTPGKDWERVPTKEVEIRETTYQKKLPVVAAKELKSYVTDKDGKVLKPGDINRVGISALNEVLTSEGKEIVELDIPPVAKAFWPDKKERSIFIVVPQGASDVSDQEIKDALTSTYGYSAKEANKAVEAYRGK